jgi:hypothetical protein
VHKPLLLMVLLMVLVLVSLVLLWAAERALKESQLELQLATRKQVADLELAQEKLQQQAAALVRTGATCVTAASAVHGCKAVLMLKSSQADASSYHGTSHWQGSTCCWVNWHMASDTVNCIGDGQPQDTQRLLLPCQLKHATCLIRSLRGISPQQFLCQISPQLNCSMLDAKALGVHLVCQRGMMS